MVPVIRDAGRKSFKEFLDAYNALVEKARTNTLTADDLSGGNLTLTNPGGHRDDRVGAAADGRPGHDRRHRRDRLSGRARSDRRGDRGREGHDDDLDLRPPDHPGRRVRPLPPADRGAAAGRGRLLRARVRATSAWRCRPLAPAARRPPRPPPAAPRAGAIPAAAPAHFDEEMLQAVQAATSLLKAHRTHGHLAAKLDPLGREPEGDPALDPVPLGLTPELMARIPARILRMYVPGQTLADALPHLRETYCGPIAYEIEHIASHRQRLWLREAIESGKFRSAAGDRGAEDAAAAADRGRRARAVHAQGLPRAEAVLDRGARHDRADARRVDPARGHPRRPRGRDRDGPPRAG